MLEIKQALFDFTKETMQQDATEMQYLYLTKGQFMVATTTYESGWQYGYMFSEQSLDINEFLQQVNEDLIAQAEEQEAKENKEQQDQLTDQQEKAIQGDKNQSPNEQGLEKEGDKEELEKEQKKSITKLFGYFPTSFTEKIEVELQEQDDEEEEEQMQNQQKQEDPLSSWASYANQMISTTDADYSYAKQFVAEVEGQDFGTQMEQNPYEDIIEKKIHKSQNSSIVPIRKQGIVGYKTITIKEPLKKGKLKKGEKQKYVEKQVQVPIKDQDPNSKSYRQLYAYFDYDKWNEEMNNYRPKKARPDISKKKKKTTLFSLK